MPISLGDAFIIETPPNKEHLYIAIAPLFNGAYLFVNLSTIRKDTYTDTSCILNPREGIHDFIVNPSYIAYRYACDYTDTTIDVAIANGLCRPRGAFSQSILEKIQAGGLASRFLKNEYKKYLRIYVSSLGR